MPEKIIKLSDENDLDAILLPKIKDETEEYVIPPVRRDILPRGTTSTPYFPLNFGMEDIVIDTIAKKYDRDIKHYPIDDPDEEHFLIGLKSCKEAKRLKCPYMKKTFARLKDKKDFPFNELLAIYLLNIDDGEENRQEFVAMTKDGFHILSTTFEIRYFPFDEIVFTEDGIDAFDRAASFEGHLLTYAFDEDFLNFLHEFSLLRISSMADIRECHPFMENHSHDLVENYLNNYLNDKNKFFPTMATPEQREAYLRFLVDTATAEGYTDAKTMLRLIYLAREFEVTSTSLAAWLGETYTGGGVKKNKLVEFLRTTLELLGTPEQAAAFYQDAIEAAMGDDGEFHRPHLLKLIRGEQFAGEKFVDAYMDFVKQRRQAEILLEKSFRLMKKQEIRLPNAVRMQNFNNRLNLQITMIGAMTNE